MSIIIIIKMIISNGDIHTVCGVYLSMFNDRSVRVPHSVCVCRRVIDKRIDSMEQSFLIEMYVICCERT